MVKGSHKNREPPSYVYLYIYIYATIHIRLTVIEIVMQIGIAEELKSKDMDRIVSTSGINTFESCK